MKNFYLRQQSAQYLKKFLIVLMLFPLLVQGQSYDPNNAYHYNRENYFARNGFIDVNPWFEWWYYKVVLPEKNKAYYFAYGIVNPWDKNNTLKGTRSYVGMGSFSDRKSLTQYFPISDFKAEYKSTHVQVGAPNIATQTQLVGDIIDGNSDAASWNISVEKKWSFNATGWATGKNVTVIEWYPAQASATCSGEVVVNGVKEVFQNAPCYQDRNWGSQFPDWWAWIVSNHFENSPDTALAVGGGLTSVNGLVQPPYEGFTIGLKYLGREYIWKTPSGDWIQYDVRFGTWEIDASNLNYRITISATAPREKFMDLQFVTPNGQAFHDYEALQGDAIVRLYRNSGLIIPDWNLVAEFVTHQTGLEYGSYKELSE